MGQGLSGSSKLIIAARGYSKEQSQIQADPISGAIRGEQPIQLTFAICRPSKNEQKADPYRSTESEALSVSGPLARPKSQSELLFTGGHHRRGLRHHHRSHVLRHHPHRSHVLRRNCDHHRELRQSGRPRRSHAYHRHRSWGYWAERLAWAGFEASESSVLLLLEAILEVTCHGSLVGYPA